MIGNDGSTKNHLINHETAFNIHNSPQHHRDRNACGFLLTSKSKTPRRSSEAYSKLVSEAFPILASGDTPRTES
jgi:hypothetical protein